MNIVCIECGRDDDLRGEPTDDDLIRLTCEACDVSWLRNPNPHCERCGGTDMEAAPQVLLEKSRGTQMSIMGIQRVFLCRSCDGDRIARQRAGHLPDRLGSSGWASGPSVSQLRP